MARRAAELDHPGGTGNRQSMMDKKKPHEPYAVPLPFDPVRPLFTADGIFQISSDDCLDSLDDATEVRLHVSLARADAAAQMHPLVKRLTPGKDDPFRPDAHYLPCPLFRDGGRFSFTLQLMLERQDAERLAKGAPARRALAQNCVKLCAEDTELCLIGYATLHGRFSRESDVLQDSTTEDRTGDRDRDGEVDDGLADPRRYNLHLHPDAIFLAKPFRGNGLGLLAGVALARPICDELDALARRTAALGVEIILEIETYFEIYSDGGEAAVAVFHEKLQTHREMMQGRPGFSMEKILQNGGW